MAIFNSYVALLRAVYLNMLSSHEMIPVACAVAVLRGDGIVYSKGGGPPRSGEAFGGSILAAEIDS